MLKYWKRYDFKKYGWTILLCIIILCSLGIYVLSRVQGEDFDMVSRQTRGLVAGIFLAVFVSLFDYHFICLFTPLMYLLNLALLFIVKYVDSLNVKQGGVYRWIQIPHTGIVFQPSELTKIFLVLCLAVLFDRCMNRMKQIYVFLLAIVLVGGGILLVFLQPDLSTTVVICVTMVVMVFASGLTYKILIPVVLVAIPVAAGLFWYVQQDFQVLLTEDQQTRVMSILHPDVYTDTIYQQENSVRAIASGGLTGKFFSGESTLGAKNIPVIESDFIFSGMAEAFGFLGSCAIILMIVYIAFRCFVIAMNATDYLGRLIAIGVGTTFIFQAFVNIGVVTMLLPNTGIPLPFVSYGLSSLMCNMIGVGIVLNIGIYKKKTRNQIDLDFLSDPRKGEL